MAILKIKKLIEDIENNTSLVLGTVTKVASTAANAGTSDYSSTAANAGTSAFSTTAGRAGTARVAHYASSGTAALAGTNAIFATGL